MKHNVDLTLNRAFSGPNIANLIDLRELAEELQRTRRIARVINTDADLADPDHEIVYTGNRSDRETKRYCRRKEEKESYCDCCGRPLSFVPWKENNYSVLCKKCEERFVEENDFRKPIHIRIPYYEIIMAQQNDNENQRPIDNIFLWD